jgi:hypothetical protein
VRICAWHTSATIAAWGEIEMDWPMPSSTTSTSAATSPQGSAIAMPARPERTRPARTKAGSGRLPSRARRETTHPAIHGTSTTISTEYSMISRPAIAALPARLHDVERDEVVAERDQDHLRRHRREEQQREEPAVGERREGGAARCRWRGLGGPRGIRRQAPPCEQQPQRREPRAERERAPVPRTRPRGCRRSTGRR